MSDITMCKGTKCPIKEYCYRYTAIPTPYRQSFFCEAPIEDGKCKHYDWDWNKVTQKERETLSKPLQEARANYGTFLDTMPEDEKEELLDEVDRTIYNFLINKKETEKCT